MDGSLFFTGGKTPEIHSQLNLAYSFTILNIIICKLAGWSLSTSLNGELPDNHL